MQEQAFVLAEREVKYASALIESFVNNVETSTIQSGMIIEHILRFPDAGGEVIHALVSGNKHIVGAGVAFVAGYYPQKGKHFMSYAYRENDSIKFKSNMGSKYDYFSMPWYTIPITEKVPVWSEPYYDKAATHRLITTFSYPFKDEAGNIVGVVTADISIDYFSAMIHKIKPYENAYAYMLSKKAAYLAHPKKERILQINYFSATESMKDVETIHNIGNNMLAGKTGREEFLNDEGNKAYVFYAPIPTTSWSVGIVVSKEEILKELNRVKTKSTILRGISMILIFGFIFYFMRRIVANLPKISSAAKIIAQGNFDSELPMIKTNDEIQELRDSFEFMRCSIKKYVQDLDEANKTKHQFEGELQIARVIQLSMVPKIFPPFPNRNDIDIYAILTPAKEVGGDLYDFFLEGNLLFFVIGDVSGKGVPAALLMALARSMFRSMAAHLQDVKKIVEYVNKSIEETNEANMFITLFAGVLNLDTGELAYCNAGHNPPVLISKIKGVTYLSCEANIPIGVLGNFEYTSETTFIAKGDTLFLYTDGLTEAMNYMSKQFGEKRLLEALSNHVNFSPKVSIQKIENEVAKFVNGQEAHDDLTILSIQLKEGKNTQMKAIEVVFKNEISEIEKLPAIMTRLHTQWQVDTALCMGIRMALDEALTNVIMYAYPEENPCEICLQITKEGNVLSFKISDNGIPFDPTLMPDVDTTTSAEDRKIGGLGIFMIRQIMDEVSYLRLENTNIFTFKKTIKN